MSIQLNKDLSVSQLTDEERLILRHRIEDRIKKENWKKFIVFMIGILVFSGFVLMFLVFFDRLF